MQITNSNKSHINKFLLPYDIYERHRQVGSLIENHESVLDIGGELDQLSQFCKSPKILVANLPDSQEKSDIHIKKNKLPFSENSFDVVCAIDVLEHNPKKERKIFIRNLIRVAKDKVIISFPIGTDEHIKYEKETTSWLAAKQKNVTYLKEHMKFGLPTSAEIAEYIRGFKSEIFYSGNININKYIFKLYIFDPKTKFIRRLIYCLKLFINFLTNPFFYHLLTGKQFSNQVNRAYLIIYK